MAPGPSTRRITPRAAGGACAWPPVSQSQEHRTEHAEVDVGHTALNERMLTEVLRANPEVGSRLAAYGARGLDCYLRFLTDCLTASRESLHALSAAA